ncbi:hypothetical protein MKX03_023985 [Papaver bracteatum]|nr:hypothetical protein MKX03_023985 [Papaver bracteatum]
MGTKIWSYCYLCFLLNILVLSASFGLFRICLAYNDSESKLSAFFVFGDSLVDPGNNNRLNNIAKYNVWPNGIDFPGAIPTGRYTNGRTAVDFLAQGLGFKNFIPAYNNPATAGEIVFNGVNYASGGSGILDKSGYIFGQRICMNDQLANFAKTRQYIISSIGTDAATELFSNAIFAVGMGANDFLVNYYTPVLSILEQTLIPPEVFVDAMISEYRPQLTKLYEMGARKFVIQNVPPIGCVPLERDLNHLWVGDSCVTSMNDAAMLFNAKLKTLVSELNSNLVGSKFVYADLYYIASDIIENYQSFGLENYNSACCRQLGRYGGLGLCGPTAKVCSDRSKYFFWDAVHPTEAVNLIVAKRLLDGGPKDIYPINIRQLCSS